jgi:hypothetical protein
MTAWILTPGREILRSILIRQHGNAGKRHCQACALVHP